MEKQTKKMKRKEIISEIIILIPFSVAFTFCKDKNCMMTFNPPLTSLQRYVSHNLIQTGLPFFQLLRIPLGSSQSLSLSHMLFNSPELIDKF
jgi:hypothetical protein